MHAARSHPVSTTLDASCDASLCESKGIASTTLPFRTQRHNAPSVKEASLKMTIYRVIWGGRTGAKWRIALITFKGKHDPTSVEPVQRGAGAHRCISHGLRL